MMKRVCMILLLFVAFALAAAEQPPFLTVPWKRSPDQIELFANTGKMYDVSCNEYALTLYVRERAAGEPALVLIAPGDEKMQGYVLIRGKAQPKRSLETVFRAIPDPFAENIKMESLQDSRTDRNVFRITVPWENLSTILPEKNLRLVIGGTFLPLLMPQEYMAAKQKIEDAVCAAFQQKTYLNLPAGTEMSYRKKLEHYMNMMKKDSAVRVRYLRAILMEVKP